ncbi:MAG: ferritin-like domain-containing protein [Gallionella sp.]
MPTIIDIESLGLDAGAHLLIKHGLMTVPPGGKLCVTGCGTTWQVQLSAWCRNQGHQVTFTEQGECHIAHLTKSTIASGRWRGAMQTGYADPKLAGAVAEQAQACWGLSARGAAVEAGSPAMHFRLALKSEVWADSAAELYAQAVAAQWNPDVAIDWDTPFDLPEIIEGAVVQVMTYMIENEEAALLVPARFLGQLHPHFREIQALLAIQIADEARHIEVFTRRVRLKGREPALSTAGGQNSLKTLLDETDFSVAQFLLAVLGEGTFVSLLNFLHAYAPDPVTRQIARLAARDEARHVAFGMAHLMQRLEEQPQLRTSLARAVQQRNDALSATSGLNEEVFDALILLAAGEFTSSAIAAAYVRVQQLMLDMNTGRQSRLEKLGFDRPTAQQLSALHTRNFM